MHYPYYPEDLSPTSGKISGEFGEKAIAVLSAQNPMVSQIPPANLQDSPETPSFPAFPEPPSMPIPGFDMLPGISPPFGIPPSGIPTPGTGEPPLVQEVEYEGPTPQFGSTAIPMVMPEPPFFSVPSNPLLPGQYKEILSYENLQYMNGFLRTQIGKECMVVSALGGSGNVISRLGYLIGVGINYILLQDGCSESIMAIDFYSIHLVQIMGKKCPVNMFI